jgi:hypothetical protein
MLRMDCFDGAKPAVLWTNSPGSDATALSLVLWVHLNGIYNRGFLPHDEIPTLQAECLIGRRRTHRPRDFLPILQPSSR